VDGNYDGLRESLHPALRYADDSVLADELDEDLLAAVEGFGSALRSIGSFVRQAAPHALKGAITGFTVGGPVGALAGAGIGAVGSQLPAAAAPVAAQVAGALPAPTAAVPNPAALQLLAMLSQPQVIQALQALALGPAGAPTVPVAGVPVPVATVANTIQSLSEMAAAQHHFSSPRVEHHGRRWSYHLESVLGDSDPEPAERAAALLALLADSAEDDDEEVAYAHDDEADLRDLMDLYRLGEE
jgi:hypothetical protein